MTHFNPITIQRTGPNYTFIPSLPGPIHISLQARYLVTVRAINNLFTTWWSASCRPIVTKVNLETGQILEREINGQYLHYQGYSANQLAELQFLPTDQVKIKINNYPNIVTLNLTDGRLITNSIDESFQTTTFPQQSLSFRLLQVKKDNQGQDNYFEGQPTNKIHLLDSENQVVKVIDHDQPIERFYLVNNRYIFTDCHSQARLTRIIE